MNWLQPMKKISPHEAAKEICQQRYPECKVMFLAGSVLREEATPYSDLDLVVVYDSLDAAYRESFIHASWPVEAFVHDPHTLKYFLEMDAKAGKPFLAHMVANGVVISHHLGPDSLDFSGALKQICQECLDKGPPPLAMEDLTRRRYAITDLVDDMRAPRSNAELMASGARLLDELADFYFRSNDIWSASGKSIFRKLTAHDAEIAKRFESSFRTLFAQSDPSDCITLAEDLLRPSGGFLFDGYRQKAPPAWKSR